jgi:hypothetical protein
VSIASIEDLFSRIDEDGGGTLDNDEIAAFLAEDGLGAFLSSPRPPAAALFHRTPHTTAMQLS